MTSKLEKGKWNEDENGGCVPPDFVCDGYNHCSDGSDESEEVCGQCPIKGFFTCESGVNPGRGVCIHPDNVCDGHKDCEDGSDESPTDPGKWVKCTLFPPGK